MARAYPYELRIRVMEALRAKLTVAEVMEIFKICRDTIYKWKAIEEETGDVKAKTGYQSGKSRKVIKDTIKFRQFIEKNQGKSLKELAMIWPDKVSPSSIGRSLRELNYTYKKNFLSPKKKR